MYRTQASAEADAGRVWTMQWECSVSNFNSWPQSTTTANGTLTLMIKHPLADWCHLLNRSQLTLLHTQCEERLRYIHQATRARFAPG